MSIQLTGITIEERVITKCRRSYSFICHYPYDDFVNVEDENLLFRGIFKDISLFCQQLIHDLSDNDNFAAISKPKLSALIIEIDQDFDWIKDGIKDEVITKIQSCVRLTFGPDVKIILEDYTFL